jgi:hypothetical protein
MDSRVGSRPSHYEVLGLAPTASREEIADAFAKRMRSPHLMADAAQIGIAYAVLRDPVRRRDYDRSLGLGAQAEPQARQWTYRVQPRWEPFIASPAPKRIVGGATPPEPHVTPQPEPEPAPARPPLPRVQLELLARPERSRGADGGGINWKIPVIAVSGLVLSVGLLGAWAGIIAGREVDAAQAEPATTVALPRARPHATAAAAPQAVVVAPGARQAGSPYRSKPKAARPGLVAATVPRDEAGTQADALAGDPLAPEPAATQPVAASLPLPNKVIARTIQRIGYACGEVASTTEGGAPGVYTVTCTSGQAYQATPVHGRYRFRRVRG